MKYNIYMVGLFLSLSLLAKGQSAEESIYRKGKFYSSQETEIIFSFANISSDSTEIDNNMRWSPVFNFALHSNYDVSNHLGFMAGLAIRNVGFIAKFPNADNNLKIKYRTYNLGLPIGLKIGDLDQQNPFFFFGGYELELPFHYKEKRFENGDKKDKITSWFTNRTDVLTQSVYAGMQLPSGFSIKFKYYLNNFFNKDYKEFIDTDGGQRLETQPFAGFDANVFYFSLTWFPFRDVNLFLDEIKPENGTVTANARGF